ncbi:dolichol-phosphate mannosyltransferase [Maridesulfovibrio ferrireducens]|uniref:Dolichol-phosphate mannosyltransferase n=1 Tax=Maridesulfovibrio ferrireducens TaxID=246191 RepID=A0A1G9CNB3_9BACT|nr:glycosyltransferase family 2 protein [Maridesulfovibrio ferrireducens]SDK53128.1 dolichol-phosphate mannosyltransferase [Maridesulfovibrio ferrireducens]
MNDGNNSNEGRKRLISLVFPVFNEAENIPVLLKEVRRAIECISKRYEFEFIFTDNCSSDETFKLLAEEAKRDRRIRVFRFSRNFGFQRSILTGFYKARGDAAIQLDADLQDPPSMIPQMIEKWEEGYDVVYGIRVKRDESWLLEKTRKLYYHIVHVASEQPLPRNAGDFRLISHRVLTVLRSLHNGTPYLRGTIGEIGFRQCGIEYDRAQRSAGESKFKLRALMNFALDGIFHQSVLPLRISAYFGFFLFALTSGGALYYLIRYAAASSDWPPGFATLVLLLLVTLMTNAVFFAIIGEYIGRLYKSTKGFPITIIDVSIDPYCENGAKCSAESRAVNIIDPNFGKSDL